MNKEELFMNIRAKKSFLCVGLDSDISKIPMCMRDKADCVFRFNKEIIDATNQYCVAYKPNLAFYECRGNQGIVDYERTVDYIRITYPDQFIIADAKRGDIGNTSAMYAQSFFSSHIVDAVTVAPYMGSDSVAPFLMFPEAWVVLLALTSNKGAKDFQLQKLSNGKYLFESVLETSKTWDHADHLMYVVGATQAEYLKKVREIVPDNFLLVPGIGAQGGSLEEVAKNGLNSQCGLLVNASRSIIFAGDCDTFAQKSADEAKKIQQQMQKILKDHELIY